MRRLSFYIIRQIAGPFALFTLLLTLVVWLTQSLRLLDLVINGGQSAGVFLYLSAMVLPGLLVIIVPVAFFGAVLYALHRLNHDSEMVVMWSAGLSRIQMARPVLIAAFGAAAITLLCSVYLMPLGQRAVTDKIFDISTDISAAILREGTFTTPTSGLTVFVNEIESNRTMHGILVHDNRDRQKPVTYLAEEGVIVRTEDGPRLIMVNGNVQRSEDQGARLSVLQFTRYVFDLSQFAPQQKPADRDPNERFLTELFSPSASEMPNDDTQRIYHAEAHSRLAAALYCFAFALISLAALAKGQMARSGYVMRVFFAAIMAAGLRISGYLAQNLAAQDETYTALLYITPLAGIIGGALVFADVAFGRSTKQSELAGRGNG